MSFRLKLLFTMVLLVVGITAATLLITENQVRVSNERRFQQIFRFQVASFLQQREARLQPVKKSVTDAAASTRLFAAMENACQDHPEQRDIDDLYQNGSDQLSRLFAESAGAQGGAGFYLFLNGNGDLLSPSKQMKLSFSFGGLQRIAPQLKKISASLGALKTPEAGYLAPEQSGDFRAIREVVFTPIIDEVTHKKMGVMGVGFPLPESKESTPVLSAIWLDGKLFASAIPQQILKDVEDAIEPRLQARTVSQFDFPLSIHGVAHQVFCQALNSDPGFPPAYQVCLYSLADALAETTLFRQRILISGTAASLLALLLSWFMSRSLTVPIMELVAGTSEIERGNFGAKVKARGGDEVGKLGRAFNAMADRIQNTYAALEQKIAERTHELAERKKAEEALRQSEASLREAQRIAHFGNWEWDVRTNQLRWSDEVFSMFGEEAKKLTPTYEMFLERVHPADREKVQQALRESLKSAQPYSLEHRIQRPDGEQRIVREKGEVLRDSTGAVVRMVGTVQDITEQKQIEAQILRAQRMDSIGAIAGGMAHDLNNALAPILMGVQLIRNKVADAHVQQMLTVMETNTHRGADMVKQVLTFARGRDGERELLNLDRLIREMEHILRQTMPKSILVQTLVPSDLWQVLGNGTQLHQALLNLCVNARDAMPHGGELSIAADNVELDPAEASEIPEGKPGAYVVLLVSDTGTGIPPEVLPKIFDAFFTTKEPGKGTGLGLSTIVRIVRNHNGFISVKSKVGSGTTFELYLPRAEKPVATATFEITGAEVQKPGHGELILFVDDDRSVREMVAPTLVEQGYRILTAANGAEALALASQHERDLRLVLTDVAMPVMDGLEFIEKLHGLAAKLPVVVISGTMETSRDRLPPGAVAFLNKPFRLEQLLGAIHEALNPQPTSRQTHVTAK